MMNIIRADIYAILRGKALYVTFGLLILFHISVIGTQTMGGINFGGIEGIGVEMPQIGFDGIRSATLLYTRLDNTVFFLLPLIILASAPIFTFGTVKNDIARGISRTKLYLSKLTIALSLCLIMVVFYMGTGMALATALNGWGGTAPDGHWLNTLQTLGAQTLMMLALTCIGVFLVFTFKNTATANAAYIAFCLVPALIFGFLLEANFNVLRLMEFDIMLGINRLGFLSQLETRTIITILSVGVFYTAVSTIAGIALFRKAEIK